MKGIHIATITMCVASAVAATGLGVSSSWAQSTAPRYEVDATFPKPFPDPAGSAAIASTRRTTCFFSTVRMCWRGN